MKVLLSSLLLTAAAFGQNPANPTIITFNRTDSEHCKVVALGGKPLLESTYEGTTVAIGMPENMRNGEFSVLVYIHQAAARTFQVAPKKFFALYSDPAHTRFPFYDKAAEMEMSARAQATAAGHSGANAQIDMGMMGRDAAPPGPPPDPGAGHKAEPNSPPAAGPQIFLHKTTVKQGATVYGYVFFKKPKNAKLQIAPTDMLGEIDIPVNGIVFRF